MCAVLSHRHQPSFAAVEPDTKTVQIILSGFADFNVRKCSEFVQIDVTDIVLAYVDGNRNRFNESASVTLPAIRVGFATALAADLPALDGPDDSVAARAIAFTARP